jgi:hypothetical protein
MIFFGKTGLHLLEAFIVHLGGIDVTTHDLRAEGLGEMETGLHRGIGMVGIIDWDIDGLIHQSASSKALSGQRAKGIIVRKSKWLTGRAPPKEE